MIAILGDTHLPRGSRRLPERCLELLRQSDLILHTGDFTSLAARRELEELAPVAAVRGNVDDADVRALLPERLVLTHAGFRIGLVHDAGAAHGRHERLAAWFPDCDLVAYGHTHAPEVARHDGRWIVNPGSPTERRRAPSRTLAVFDRGRPRLVELSR